MKTAFLRLVGLTAADHKQIEVFLRFTGRTDGFQWISTAGDLCDLQLESAPVDGVVAPLPLSDRHRPASRAWILDRGERAPDDESPVLRRPLQIDGFEALLRTRELHLARVTAAASLAPAVPAAASARKLEAQAAGGAAGTLPFADDGRRTYRLKRWPGSDLLRGKPRYVRMLGFLSNRPLSLARLAMLSGIDEAGCRDLLAMLDQRGLLVRGDAGPDSGLSMFADTVPSGLVAATTAAAAPARVREPAIAGLFSRLRMRLGLASGS